MISVLFAFYLHATEIPFWKKKPHVYKRIEAGEVIVSANLEEKKEGEYLKLQSAGHIKTPLAFTWREILKFENYDKISDNFKEIQHQPKKKDLFLMMGAFDYYASLWIRYQTKSLSKNQKLLEWETYKGGFKGLKGRILLESKGPDKTEISILADLSAKKIPIPAAFMKIGLEFVGKIMAKKMRSYIEKSYETTDFYEE